MATQVELKPYPYPKGMDVPHLMPYQMFPWNGDHHLAAEVLRLKEAHGLTMAIETGTCLGSTTMWLAENFLERVITMEINLDFISIAERRSQMVSLYHEQWIGDSALMMPAVVDILNDLNSSAFMFLDAHWNQYCPLLHELAAISKSKVKPCILIHDFFVPGTDFGYDKMPDGKPFNLELIQGHLDRIYGKGKWKHNYPTEVAGARRGWISIEPCDTDGKA